MPLPLRDYQIKDLAYYIAYPRCANLSDPGTGKTASLNVYMWYRLKEKQERSIFVMPISLFKQNKDSFFKFTNFDKTDVEMVRGTLTERQRIMRSDAKVFIVGFDFFKPRIWTDRATKLKKGRESDYEYLCRHHRDIRTCVIDEFHMGYGNPESNRTMWWNKAMQDMNSVIPMTGTPIDGALGTVYPIIHIIEPRYYFNYKNFIARHGIEDEYGKVVGWVRVDKVKEILARHTIRHSFEEIFGKEAIELIVQPIEMGEQHRAIYEDFESNNLIELDNEFKEMSSGGETSLRARQILQCPEAIWGKTNYPLAKDEWLETCVVGARQAKKAFIVFSPFQAEQERLTQIFTDAGLKIGMINANVTGRKRDIISEAFQTGQLDGVVASPLTVSVGYDWAHVDIVAFTTLDYRDSSFIQGYKRAVRGKRERPLLVYVLEYENSVDRRVFQVVQQKMELAHEVDESRQVFSFVRQKPPRNISQLQAGKSLNMSKI